MSYKDREKQKEANREAQRRRREASKMKAGESNEAYKNGRNVVPDNEPEKPEEIKEPEEKEEKIEIKYPEETPAWNPPEKTPPNPLTSTILGPPLPPPPLFVETTPEEKAARECIRKTRQLLDRQGWCLWKCSKLNMDIVVVAKDESITGYPELLPVYTVEEINKTVFMSFKTFRMVHEAKKKAQAILI